MIVKRQHYIPRFYMNLYSNQKGKINTFMKKRRVCLENQNVINMGVEGYFYDLTDEEIEELKNLKFDGIFENTLNVDLRNIDKQSIEKYFAKEEGKVSLVLNELLDKIKSLSDEELLSSELQEFIDEKSKKTIAEFMTIQTIRVPSVIQGNKEILDAIGFEHNMSDNSFLFYQLSSGMQERVSNYMMNNFNWNLMVIDKPEDAKFSSVAKTFPTKEFLLSDAPVVILEDVLLKGKTFSLTLNSKYLIQLTPKNTENNKDKILSANRNDVRIINEYHLRFSMKYIFFNQKESKKK